MKKIVSVLVISVLMVSSVLATTTCTDVQDHWASEEITFLFENGVINGYEDGTFKPNQTITIAEFLKVLVEVADYSLITEGEKWPNWYIETAKENGIIAERENYDFFAGITRSQAVLLISRYIGLQEVTKSKNTFSDLAPEEKENVLKLVNLGVIQGYEDGTFRGQNVVTRAEACKMLFNAMKAQKKLVRKRDYPFNNALTNYFEENELKKVNDYANLPETAWQKNQYTIRGHRIYIYDTGRYGNFNGQTLNPDFIKDSQIINTLQALLNENAYTELKYIPDKYIVNSVNLCYGKNQKEVHDGRFYFQIRFYENSLYDVSKSLDDERFMKDAFVKIKTNKMWETKTDLENESSCSEEILYRLGEAVGEILDDSVKDEFVSYVVAKKIEAKQIADQEEAKIKEIKKIGKYTLNTYCRQGTDLEIFIQKIK